MTNSYAPPYVFISYSHADSKFVTRLKTDLHAQGINIWIDREGLQPGTTDWEEALREAIRASQAVLYVASPNARNSRYVKDELRIADETYQRPLFPIWSAGSKFIDAVPIGYGGSQYIDAREPRYQAALDEIVVVLRGLHNRSHPPPDLHFEPRNPYKGLLAFTDKDSQDFFGREALIEELADALEETLTIEKKSNKGARLLAVVGPSGSGKSSVIMAGLLPCLQKGGVLDSEEWVYLDPIVPGEHPLESLALTLGQKLSDKSHKTIQEDLEDESARGLHRIACSLARQLGKKVVLFVDQFEELFTLTTSEDERQQFIGLLMAAATERFGPTILIITLRADLYDRPIQYPQLGKLLQEHHKLLLLMEIKELREAVKKPAELPDVQLFFEGDLVGDLLFEVRGEVGALPLLQFTLDQLFQRRLQRYEHQLTLRAYNEMGGVNGALSQHAEATYQKLPSDEHRKMAREVFLRLIMPGTTEKDTTRRRAARSEFKRADPIQTQQMQETLEALIIGRLLTTNQSHR
jgi:hypothetical protein